MSILTGTVIKLQDCSLGFEHVVPVGQAMLGHVPADVYPGYDNVREIIKFATPADDQMGLFDPNPHINSKIHAFCTTIQIRQNAGLAWAVYVTNGDPSEGAPTAEEIHDPDYDLLLASGTGSSFVKVGLELMPQQRIRVVLGIAAVIPSRVVAMFCSTIGAGGRLIT